MPRRIVWASCFVLGCNPGSPPNAPPLVVLDASAGDATEKKASFLYVDDKLVDCEGEYPMKCMRTRSSTDGEWELLYTPIEGFAFEEGNAYELRVDLTDPKKPRLVEIVSKKKVTANK